MPNGKVYTKDFEPLKTFSNNSGYLYVRIPNCDAPVAIHKLVAMSYLNGGGRISHVNGDKEDNRVSNLKYK